ncbi:MAG: glycosyltransferase [Muribaculaceae bacterium]|nr:glycosyltransferase [Muribaculaceae bacterium]
MSNRNFEYSVAIRTLGTGGEKYRQELESLHRQTIKPKHIFIYLAEGYKRPDFQVGIEEYIPVHKGLVHQRAASLQGVDTDYILILDDDIFFPDDGVEKLYESMIAHGADCIAPETFNNAGMSQFMKLGYYMANGVVARPDDDNAIKIMRNGTFSFNRNPKKGAVSPTQSFPGTACLCKTEAFRKIHYEDELWIDQFPAGTFGEDQIMSYKLHKNGYKVVMAHDTGILHLDAGTNNIHNKTYKKIKFRALSYYMTWYRTCYDLKGNNALEKFRCILAFSWRFGLGTLTRALFSIAKFQPKHLIGYIHGTLKGIAFAQSKEYKAQKNFIIAK